MMRPIIAPTLDDLVANPAQIAELPPAVHKALRTRAVSLLLALDLNEPAASAPAAASGSDEAALTVRETAALLKCHPKTLLQRRHEEHLQVCLLPTVGRNIRFSRRKVLELLQQAGLSARNPVFPEPLRKGIIASRPASSPRRLPQL